MNEPRKPHGLLGKTLAEAKACVLANWGTLRVYDYQNKPVEKVGNGDFAVRVQVVNGKVVKVR